jgi:hypothetical protein
MTKMVLTCDRCGREGANYPNCPHDIKIETYKVEAGWCGYSPILSERLDLCSGCKAIVDAALTEAWIRVMTVGPAGGKEEAR